MSDKEKKAAVSRKRKAEKKGEHGEHIEKLIIQNNKKVI